MTVALLSESAKSTEARGHVCNAKDVPTTSTYPTTALTRPVSSEFITLTGKVVGWVVEFLSTSASRARAVQVQPQPQSAAAKRIAALWDEVEATVRLHSDWNGYGSEPPNEFARDLAKQILLSATSVIVPNRVAPSAQGGVGICFYRNRKYGDIECLNTGEILATVSDGTAMPDVWEVKPTDLKGALERIGQFINS